MFVLIFLPDVEMSANVIHHVALCTEAEPTVLRTGKGPVVGVNEHVRF
jgi:hypothetical protein